jgi:hypothetical protein
VCIAWKKRCMRYPWHTVSVLAWFDWSISVIAGIDMKHSETLADDVHDVAVPNDSDMQDYYDKSALMLSSHSTCRQTQRSYTTHNPGISTNRPTLNGSIGKSSVLSDA